MLGAIIGDLAGSIYEYDQVKQVKPIRVQNIIAENAFISDDTILTMAIADAILQHASYAEKLQQYALKYENKLPTDLPYFKTVFSPGFTQWAKSKGQGSSSGNGAMMRISPVGYLFNNAADVIENARLATMPSHNSQSAIQSATLVALIIFYARNGLSKPEIMQKLNLTIRKPVIETFNYTCQDTMPLCLYALFKANSFAESIRLALTFGGDTDTNACIVGSMAEAMYGIDEALKRQALAKVPPEFLPVLEKCYQQINGQQPEQKLRTAKKLPQPKDKVLGGEATFTPSRF